MVYVSFLLERIEHAELVLDRMLTGLRPGGLLLMRMRDRDVGLRDVRPADARPGCGGCSGAGLVPAGAAGPLPAVYEPVASREGMHVLLPDPRADGHGRRVRDQRAGAGRASRQARPVRPARWWMLSRGRLPASHDEITMVIRKPQNHFARLI